MRAERDAARQQAQTERFGALLSMIGQRDDRAEVRNLQQQVSNLTQELFNARLENSRLQSELTMMRLMLNFGTSTISGTGLNGAYTDDISGNFAVM